MNSELETSPPDSNNNMRKRLINASFFAILLVFILASYLIYSRYATAFLPGTTINDIEIGGLTIEEASEKFAGSAVTPANHELKIFVDDITVSTSSASLDTSYQFDEVAKTAFVQGKSGMPIERFLSILKAFIMPNHFDARLEYDQEKLANLITDLKLNVDVIGEEPSATLEQSGNINTLKINPGEPGRVLEAEKTAELSQQLLNDGEYRVSASVASTSASLTEEQQTLALERSQSLVSQKLELILDADEYVRLEVSDRDLVAFLNFPELNSYKTDIIKEKIDTWAKTVDRQPQNAVLEYDKNTLEVEKFVPHKLGLELNTQKTIDDVIAKLVEIEKLGDEKDEENDEDVGDDKNDNNNKNHELVATSTTTEPDIALEKTNPLGIKERIGYGESEYDHSIPNRIHNVSITTDRVSNILVAPGEEFSFNKALGEVSARTGFRSAYVIRNGRTELGDGGGVCQVSTTLFRSVLNAGLDVTLRLPHSYRVSYYELDSKPGADATVYSGNIDFRFKNDTDHHILIHGEADSENLNMFYEIYGTSDGRSAEIVDHRVWDARSAPEPQYFDDPTLPTGTIKQIDFATGGVKASFKNVIKDKNGEIIREDEYYSNYRPWSAKFLRGTGV